MTSITRTMLIVSISYCIITVCLLVYAVTSVNASGRELASIDATLKEQAQKKLASEAIASVIKNSESDRERLTHYFLADEAEVLTLIALIESIAQGLGIELSTNELSIVPATDAAPAFLQTGFRVEGSEYGTMNFLRAIELLPYHSQIMTVDISRDDKNTTLTIGLTVTMLPTI